jgi:L-alanine-DL-glutamate epimerase-like enolase superfamily enzyme
MKSLESITLYRLELPLKVPYKLAFGPVTHFDTLIASVTDADGNQGLGEATILTGYTPETIEGSWDLIQALAKELVMQSDESNQQLLNQYLASDPFTVTALASAIEFAKQRGSFGTQSSASVPILGVVNSESLEDLELEIERLISSGFKTLKVKVGFDVEKDSLKVKNVQRVLKERAKIRLDGNQGYSRSEAIRFIELLDPAGIELFEQPCHADDWDSALAISKIANVPMMLDESIYGLEDIQRAADLKIATYIKVKLMKFGSYQNLSNALSLISNLGMKPVLGNGVAGEIGCWMEALAAKTHITNAGEMNGFLKPVSSVLQNPLQFKDGCILLEPAYIPNVDLNLINQYQISTKQYY